MNTLIKTLYGENGKLFTIIDGRRILLAECRPEIRIYENSQRINRPGAQGYSVKMMNVVLAVCRERALTRDVDADFLQTVSRFEFVCDIQHEDGMFERIAFDNAVPDELHLDGDWRFELIARYDIVQKLLNF